MRRYLLSIESTCDETAAAVIAEPPVAGQEVLPEVISSVVSSQTALHERFGGVVPELAARAHLERIVPVIDEALRKARINPRQLSAVAVATQPGLIGSLLVGVNAAKAFAVACEIPLIALDHVAAHLYACQLSAGRTVYPAVGLVVSGGHTNLYHCRSALDLDLLGSTIDDAAGEAFDKVAQILGLGYPGGPEVSRLAVAGNSAAFSFPRTFLRDERMSFSFSGLKTAVLYAVQGQPGARTQPPPLTDQRRADIAASFEAAVVDVLVEKSMQAVQRTGVARLCVGGGVAANRRLRDQFTQSCAAADVELIIADPDLCTDNAAMGAIAWETFNAGDFADLELDPTPGLVRAG